MQDPNGLPILGKASDNGGAKAAEKALAAAVANAPLRIVPESEVSGER